MLIELSYLGQNLLIDYSYYEQCPPPLSLLYRGIYECTPSLAKIAFIASLKICNNVWLRRHGARKKLEIRPSVLLFLFVNLDQGFFVSLASALWQCNPRVQIDFDRDQTAREDSS